MQLLAQVFDRATFTPYHTRHLIPSRLGLLGCILSLPPAPTGAFDRFDGRLGDPLSDETEAKDELEAGVPMELWKLELELDPEGLGRMACLRLGIAIAEDEDEDMIATVITREQM